MTAQTILPANSVVATGYDVANSCRFDDGSSAYMHRTPSAGNRRTMTLSVWIKGSSLSDGSNNVLGQYNSSNENNAMLLVIEGAGKIMVWNYTTDAYTMDIRTTRLLRDNSAWYHIVVAVDTTQSTASNRVKVYVNGVQETSLHNGSNAAATYPSENLELFLNQGVAQNIGTQRYGSTVGSPFDGYMAEFCFIEGTQNAPTDFGEFDDSGIWKPIDVSDLTFGTNGYYLDFEDSSALGNDVSGNDNDFTTVNLAAIDQSTDTCTNNFATFNPLDKTGTGAPTGSEGNLKLTGDASTNNTWNSTIGLSAGKWYVEMKVLQSTPDTSIVFRAQTNTSGSHNNSYGFDTNPDTKVLNGSSSGSAIGSTSQNDILGMALDLDNGKMFIHRNGTYFSSGNPSTGANPFIVTADGMPTEGVIGGHIYDGAVEWNFGSPSYSESGGETDGNGYGNFAHAVPSGYYSLNTKNLAEYG